jgi:hypothetical protein
MFGRESGIFQNDSDEDIMSSDKTHPRGKYDKQAANLGKQLNGLKEIGDQITALRNQQQKTSSNFMKLHTFYQKAGHLGTSKNTESRTGDGFYSRRKRI